MAGDADLKFVEVKIAFRIDWYRPEEKGRAYYIVKAAYRYFGESGGAWRMETGKIRHWLKSRRRRCTTKGPG